jgi:hypothetical protein
MAESICQPLCHVYLAYGRRSEMRRKKKPGYYTLLALTILFALGAVLTVMPLSYTYKECLLGYGAHCPLTPISTNVCAVFAAIAGIAARRLFTEAP